MRRLLKTRIKEKYHFVRFRKLMAARSLRCGTGMKIKFCID
jgi:hypothetical protein